MLPACEVRIPLRQLADACSRGAFEEVAQVVDLIAKVSKLSFLVPVVDLTDAATVSQVEVRCFQVRRMHGPTHEVRPGAALLFPVQAVNRTRRSTGGSADNGTAAIERIILALCIEAAASFSSDE